MEKKKKKKKIECYSYAMRQKLNETINRWAFYLVSFFVAAASFNFFSFGYVYDCVKKKSDCSKINLTKNKVVLSIWPFRLNERVTEIQISSIDRRTQIDDAKSGL